MQSSLTCLRTNNIICIDQALEAGEGWACVCDRERELLGSSNHSACCKGRIANRGIFWKGTLLHYYIYCCATTLLWTLAHFTHIHGW